MKKLKISSILFVLCIATASLVVLSTTIPNASATTNNFGYTSVGASNGGSDVNQLWVFNFSLSETAVLSGASAYLSPWGDAKMKFLIYNSTATLPNNLVATSSEIIVVAGSLAWHNFTITGTLSAGNYWLGVCTNATGFTYYYGAGGGADYGKDGLNYNSPPNPFFSSPWGPDPNRASYYVTYDTVPSTVSVTFTSSSTGVGYITVNGSAQTTPYTISTATIGDHYTIAAISPVNITWGNQYVYSSWSDSGAQSHTYTVSVAATVTASFTQQLYNLTGIPANQISSINGIPTSEIQLVNGVP
jgi:hypothetical protein